MNEQWAITAEICVYDPKKKGPVPPESIDLGYGSDLVEIFDQKKLVEVDQIVFHPDTSKNQVNLALLKLKTPFTFNDTVQPACVELDNPRQKYKDELVGFGFGVNYTSATKDGSFYGMNNRYLKESLLTDISEKSYLCSYKNLDEVICLKGTGGSK